MTNATEAYCVKCRRKVKLDCAIPLYGHGLKGTCPDCGTLIITRPTGSLEDRLDLSWLRTDIFACKLVDAVPRCDLIGATGKLALQRIGDGWFATAWALLDDGGKADFEASYSTKTGLPEADGDELTLITAERMWTWRELKGNELAAYETALMEATHNA